MLHEEQPVLLTLISSHLVRMLRVASTLQELDAATFAIQARTQHALAWQWHVASPQVTVWIKTPRPVSRSVCCAPGFGRECTKPSGQARHLFKLAEFQNAGHPGAKCSIAIKVQAACARKLLILQVLQWACSTICYGLCQPQSQPSSLPPRQCLMPHHVHGHPLPAAH